MANENDLLIRIKALDELTPVMLTAMHSMEASPLKLAQGIEKINTPTKNAQESAHGLNSGVLNLAAGLSVINAAVEIGTKIFGAFSGVIGESIHEAIEAEKSLNKLNGALISQGLYTEKNTKIIEDHVKAVEDLTGVSGEAVQSMIAMGVQMGLNVQQSMHMEEAARKLAAATGTDVMSAFNQMQAALNGQTRGLAKIVPGVKDLTEAQLKNGAAIEMVNKALAAQYGLYLGSYEVSLNKAQNAISNVYKELGKIITQNPIVIKGINQFTDWMHTLEESVISAGVWIKEHQGTIERFGTGLITAFKAGAIGLGIWAIAAAAAVGPTVALEAAIAALTAPVTLAIAAVVALTAAFYKWPGLFDQIIGSFKIFVGIFLQGISYITEKTASLVSIFNKDLSNSLKNVAGGIDKYADSWGIAGAAQVEVGAVANETADKIEAAINKENAAVKDSIKEHGDKVVQLRSIYAGIDIGTQKMRDNLALQVSDREKALKDFTSWYEAKNRLAVSKEQEQMMQVAKIRDSALKEVGGTVGKEAELRQTIAGEQAKQKALDDAHAAGMMSEETYQAGRAMLMQRYIALHVQLANVHRQAVADALGETPEGYAQKRALREEQFQLDLQQKLAQAQMDGATEEQLRLIREESIAVNRESELAALDAHHAELAAREDLSGATLTAVRQKWYDEQRRAGMESLKNFESGLTLMLSMQSGYNKATQKLGDDLIKGKKISAGKIAGIAIETMGRELQADGFKNILMGTIQSILLNPMGPAMIAAGTAEVAGGTALGRVGLSMQGGQGDEGNDLIPQSLSGKSFIISGGERVVQPSANKDLKEFLDKEKGREQSSSRSGNNVYNVTLNYGGTGGAADARAMAEIVIKEIRSASERGSLVVNKKGVYE